MNQADEELNTLVLNKELDGRKNLALGIYIHVPFCSTTCDFCAFYQEKPSKNGIESYFRGLKDEFDRFSPNREISTVFIGGGTPGLLKAKQLDELCSLVSSYDLSPDVEWSIELAPSEITPQKLDVLRQGGVTRISLGVQTFNPKFMDALGRQHSVEKTFEAYQWIRQAGFDSVNLDLLFGAPGQSLQNWEDDLAQAVDLAPDHLSTYCLTFEEDTAMFVRLSQGKVKIDPEREAEFYEFAWDYLPRHGYKQYEVSNYSKPGHACRHNLNTWAMNEWIGYGPSACTQSQGVRRKNIANLEKWAEGMKPDKEPKFVEEETLSSTEFAQDAVLFGLRMNQGISIPAIADRFDIPIDQFSAMAKLLDRLVLEDLATQPNSGNYALTRQGRILCDAIVRDLPELGSPN